jgi:hypothetical protein
MTRTSLVLLAREERASKRIKRRNVSEKREVQKSVLTTVEVNRQADPTQIHSAEAEEETGKMILLRPAAAAMRRSLIPSIHRNVGGNTDCHHHGTAIRLINANLPRYIK